MSQLTKVAITALVLGPTGAAWAAEAPAVDLSGLIYAHYGYALENQADGANAFDLDRVYLTARSRLGKGFSTRVTTDVGRTGSADDTKLRPFLKYAYLQSKLNQSYSLRFGASGTAWCGQYDAFWGHRFIAASLADKNKLLSTSDLGVQALGKHMGGLLSWQAGVINGDGYGAPEVSSTKAAQARLTVDPLSSAPTLRLPISAFISQDILVASEEQGTQTLAAAVGLQSDQLLLWTELLTQRSGDGAAAGASASAIAAVGELAKLVVRYDHFDPDRSAEDDATATLIGAVSKDIHAGISASLSYERSTPQSASDAVCHGAFVRISAGLGPGLRTPP
jgi:hypothetical protein